MQVNKSEDGKDAKDDAEKKPVGLAALAKEAEKDGGKGGSKDGKSKSKDGKQKCKFNKNIKTK
jgi:hypothetical protein